MTNVLYLRNKVSAAMCCIYATRVCERAAVRCTAYCYIVRQLAPHNMPQSPTISQCDKDAFIRVFPNDKIEIKALI
jgi:hypothetical protein